MNTDKAYILGLVIGGGVWGNNEDVFRIKLSFKQWGSYEVNPKRAGEITSITINIKFTFNFSFYIERNVFEWINERHFPYKTLINKFKNGEGLAEFV